MEESNPADTLESFETPEQTEPVVETPVSDIPITEQTIDSIADRIVDKTQQKAQHLTFGGSGQMTDVDKAYGRR